MKIDDLVLIKIVSILLILVISLVSGFYPFFKKWVSGQTDLPIGQALASGVFLGAGLLHMLGDASADFASMHFDYPIAFLLAGVVFLFFLALEHIGTEIYSRKGSGKNGFAVIAFFMLSIHSLFAGAALGLSGHLSVVITLLIAILAHKWAASFALATQIVQSSLPRKLSIMMFIIFAFMTPLGIYFGEYVSTKLDSYSFIAPVFNSIAAGTFIYLGTIHGLSRAFMIEKCCTMKNFIYVIFGFAIMAIVAIWT